MNYKQIETSREVRLWLTQVVLPAFGIGVALLAASPEAREAAAAKYNEVKYKIKNKLHK